MIILIVLVDFCVCDLVSVLFRVSLPPACRTTTMAMKAMKAKNSVQMKKCQNFRKCGRNAKSSRAKFCPSCFKENAAMKARSGSGNTIVGRSKKAAGRRSGLKRCADMALTIKKEWLDLILEGEKTWEIRGTSTQRRGYIHFAESGSGQLRGRAKLVDCRRLERSNFMQFQSRHRVPDVNMVKYKNIWAWILEEAEPYDASFDYSHKHGAVIFVTVRKPMGPAT